VPADDVPDASCDARLLADYRWMSRVAMFCAWATYSIIRSQFALRFVAIGFSEPQFGVYLTIFALCNFLALVAAGRWAFWHFQAAYLFGAQLMYLAAVLIVLFGRTLGVFYCSSVFLGLAFGFAYSSHLYYGASTSSKRSVRMAIHELVISVGIAVGAGTGGYLAKHVGWAAPYWFAIGLVALGGVIELTIHFASRLVVSHTARGACPESGQG
jgi:predicted MFS family arabinose efflux permease